MALLVWAVALCSTPGLASLIISKYSQQSDGGFVEIKNLGSTAVNLRGYEGLVFKCKSCSDGEPEEDVYASRHSLNNNFYIAPGARYVITNPFARVDDAWKDIVYGGFALITTADPDKQWDYKIIDIVGTLHGAHESSGWDVCGVQNGILTQTVVRKPTVTRGNLGQWAMSAGASLQDCEWELSSMRELLTLEDVERGAVGGLESGEESGAVDSGSSRAPSANHQDDDLAEKLMEMQSSNTVMMACLVILAVMCLLQALLILRLCLRKTTPSSGALATGVPLETAVVGSPVEQPQSKKLEP